jgi:hypothetical protein
MLDKTSNPEEYDALRVKAGMVPMLRTIKRVGMLSVATQTAKDSVYHRNGMLSGYHGE